MSVAMLGWALDPQVMSNLRARADLAVVLDYDGTLAAIAPRPDLAALEDESREVLRRLAERFPVAVLSGRALDDVRARVGVDGLVYAGCHGLEIEGGPGFVHAGAVRSARALARIGRELTAELAAIDGVVVEQKRFGVSVHYRMVEERSRARVEAAVAAALEPGMRRANGKMVHEIIPDVGWHKGRALEWILRLVDRTAALFIGDDQTDEDAFGAVGSGGAGVLVAGEPRATKASLWLRDPAEVRRLLQRMSEP